jgi:PAS domain S-box-containing protein
MTARQALGWKIAVGSALVALSLLALVWMQRANTQRLLDANRWIAHSQTVQQELERTFSALKDAEAGQRGYLLTGQASYLAPYTAAVPETARGLDSLRSLTRDNPGQQKQVVALTELTRTRLAVIEETIRLFRAGERDAAVALVETGTGRRTMDAIRATVETLRQEERALLSRRIERGEEGARRLRASSLAAASLVLTLLIALVWVLWRDVMGRARAEADLRTTLLSIGDAVLATDAEGRVTFLNPVCEGLTGWTSAEAQGRDVEEVFRILNERNRSPAENPVRRVIRDGVIVGLANHTVLVSRDGRETPIADSGAPIRDERGRVAGVVLVFRDISAQRMGEEAVHRLADVVASSQHAIVAGTLDGVVTDWNPGAEALYGFTAKEMIGRRLDELAPPGFVEPATPLDKLASGETFEVDVKRITKDGRTIDVAVHLSAIRDATGKMVGVSRIQRDVTERRRQREELVQARRRAEEANATKDRFLANLSHELRTPLTPVAASVHRLEQRTDLPSGVAESLAMIRRNVELEARLIDDLLDLTRIARGKLELHRLPLDLHELLQSVVQSSRSELLAKGLSLETHLDAAEHYGLADGGRLQQVFWNLLRNAIKFTPRGGRVIVSSDNPEPGEIRVRIADTGRGIDPDLLAHIFEPFVQGDSTAQRSGAGLGLGLAIAKNLVGEHGGSISAQSAGRSQGATFEVRLATTSARPARPSRVTSGVAAAGSREPVSVLVVEDDVDTGEAMRLLLAEAGFDVRVAGSVGAASEAFRARPADVLVSDIGLPDGSGLEVLGRLRAERADLPGIVLSGYGMEQDVAASRANGFAEHFIKPVDFDRLIAAIDRLTSRES